MAKFKIGDKGKRFSAIAEILFVGEYDYLVQWEDDTDKNIHLIKKEWFDKNYELFEEDE